MNEKRLMKKRFIHFFSNPATPLKTHTSKAFYCFIPLIHAPTTVTKLLLIKVLPIYNLLMTFTKPFFKI
ncbi:hypothetical protein ECC15_03350 [Helicobacter pylori]|nr:hypothetical protein ECB96_05170 [Helicobacter pylori]RVY36100.1 hypothetical protein ECC15_03350 [Helicobacter pylori]